MDRKMVNFIKEQYPPGTRIRLNSMEDPYHPILPGTEGEVDFVDDKGQIFMKWDNGRTLPLAPGEDSFTVLPPKLTSLKLYMPLTADLYERNEYGEFDDSSTLLEGSELRGYQNQITAALVKNRMPEEAERGIMHWYHKPDSINTKVHSAVFTVDSRGGELWGVAECRVAGELSDTELETLKEYLTGQASDGWGEGFEQRDILVDGGSELYVHLWNSDEWSIQTEQELFAPKLAEGLPELCFSTLPGTGELICIKRGESGYYPSDWSTDDPAQNRELADYNNERLGVTQEQRLAMECGSMHGWGVPGADPKAYERGGMKMGGMTLGYTMFLKARVGTELGSEPLRGHLIKMWYYDPNDTGRDNPIAATVVRTYQDKDMNGKTGTFPREVQIYQEGKPQSQYYIQVYVDAMGTNYQDAIVRLDWDNALSDNGKAARSAFTDKLATEQTINSGNTVSRTQLKKWINEDNTLLLQGKDDDLTASFSTAALESIYDESNSDVKFVLEGRKASKLTGAQAKKAGERPVYALELTHGGKAIPSIGSGSVSVTLPYALGKDETAEGLAILIVSDDGTGRNIKCTYNARSRTITFSTKNFGVFVIAYDADHIWNNPFTDVKETDWFYDAVRYVNQKGLFSGTTATTFSPNLATTRAMLVTVLYRLDGQPAVTGSSKFSDVSAGQYYTNAVIWATENGIVSGYGNGMFGSDALLSREQMATILYNYAKYKQYDVSKVRGLDVFTDKDTVAPYAVRAMQWAYANEIINGSSTTTLSPKGTATRAQVAAILMRFDEKVKTPANAAAKTAAGK